MASLAQALRSFRSGALTREGLLAELERILADGRADGMWLLNALDEENTRLPLPPDVHDAVKRRIKQASNDVSPMSGHDVADQDVSRTHLATGLFREREAAPMTGSGTRAAPHAQLAASSEPVKGPGDVLNGRFELMTCIGSGGMSTVYKALDRRKLEADDRNPYVAVKVLNIEFRAHPDSLIALQREAKKCQSLAHPNIVRVYDFDRDGSTVFMTMEYLSGKSLAQTLRAPKFQGMPEPDAMRILEGMAHALSFAHDNGIIHADFKPANVILTDAGPVKVIDFGIARAFQRGDVDMEATRFDPGSLGALTPTYASPEMLEHREPSPQDDVYALACITYEMLTGRHPFGRMQATEARDGGLQVERRNLTRRQWKALRSALAFDRALRTPSVQRFVADMKPEAKAIPVPVFVAAVVLLVVVTASVSYYLARPVQQVATTAIANALPPPVPSPAVAPRPAAEPGPRVHEPVSEIPVRPVERERTQTAPAAPVAVSPEAVRAVLAGQHCAALRFSVQSGVVAVNGYASSRLDLRQLEQTMRALPGVKGVSADLQRISDEKCGVVELYAPYWVANHDEDLGTSIRTRNRESAFVSGEPLVLDIRTPGYDSYVNVDYYALDGSVVHMVPNPRVPQNQAPPNYSATIGDLGEWVVSEPFGTELIVILTTPEPLFDTPRSEAEPAADYLEALREKLTRIAQNAGPKQLAADFVLIKTAPKGAS